MSQEWVGWWQKTLLAAKVMRDGVAGLVYSWLVHLQSSTCKPRFGCVPTTMCLDSLLWAPRYVCSEPLAQVSPKEMLMVREGRLKGLEQTGVRPWRIHAKAQRHEDPSFRARPVVG